MVPAIVFLCEYQFIENRNAEKFSMYCVLNSTAQSARSAVRFFLILLPAKDVLLFS